MPRDSDFLSPRDLLVDDNFCLALTSFRGLSNIVKKTEDLPRDDESLRQKSGFWESGYGVLYAYLSPIAQQFLTTQSVALQLNEVFTYTSTVCDSTLVLCASAPEDYDKLFTDIEALRQDPDNEDLRDRVLKNTRDRLDSVQILRDQSTDWSKRFHLSSLQAEDCETAITNLEAPFHGSALEDALRNEDSPENLQDDLDALKRVVGLLNDFSMVDDMSASLQEVQKMAGSATLIMDDIQNLVDYIQDHVSPDDNPLGGLVERKVLSKWETLHTHVIDFKNAYTN